MQGNEDLVRVRFTLECSVVLDKERANMEPLFRTLSRRGDLTEDVVLIPYLQHHLLREKPLSEMPSTCGPAQITGIRIEEVNGKRRAHLDSVVNGSPAGGV